MAPLVLLLILTTVTLAEKNPCKVCRDLTDAFQKHFDATEGQNYGGGNTAWEERSLGRNTYATSETRLVEIFEKTAKKCDYKCGSLLEDQEEYIEEWFFKRQDTDLFEEMCITELTRCCPSNRWGPDCEECPGGVETPCSGHGKCKGEGDRETDTKLTGTCSCDKGYNGTLCGECKRKFVRVDDTCEECSSLCKGQCTAPGPTGCEKCIKGYEFLEDTGCTDIDECAGDGCGDPALEDCLNSPGSYECVCKTGYARVAGKCQLEDLYASEDEGDEPTDETIEEATIESPGEGLGETEETTIETPEETKEPPSQRKVASKDTDEEEDDDDYDEVDEDSTTTFAQLKFKEQEYQENLKKLEDALGDVKNLGSNKDEL